MTRKTTKPFSGRITAPSAPWLAPEVEESSDRTKSEVEIQITDIHLPPKQPRRYFDADALQTLATSIAQHGVLQPLLVRPRSAGGYELVAGERRYRAAQLSGLKTVPVIVRELDNNEAWQIALVENLQREDLNPIEETEGILDLLALELARPLAEIPNLLRQLFNQDNRGKTGFSNSDNLGEVDNNVIINSKNDLAKTDNNVIISDGNNNELDNTNLIQQIERIFEQLGRMSWQSFVTNRLPLLKLSEIVVQALREGKIEYTKAKLIAGVKDAALQQQLLDEAIADTLSLNEIKLRIKEGSQKSLANEPTDLRSRFEATFKASKSSPVWKDAKKQKKLEALLKQLEALIS
ncbi:ParB/RepB/Spo0J family partition protein [Pseudanabaena sp. ABRG5-3]|uniref:ParB/RepB/Spo0J family partition protein n=1 Tax=Pseudanabaena sp. ABRG5-3 TaxID=685565 RepID=UPI000DC6E61D|nr:ParB/RepB/Spo0J family partition protein [Pseudanabaena sp. ABRG5-3]BBC27190.1 chromosome partitioning protein [Pseudanabaena sp. ABRG5-3]